MKRCWWMITMMAALTVMPVAAQSAAQSATQEATPDSGPTIAGCPMFPADNIWNTRVDTLPLDPHSDNYIDAIGRDTGLHPDFGAGLYDGGPIGIPYTVVAGDQPLADITFEYAD